MSAKTATATTRVFVYAYESGARLLDGYTTGSFNVSRDFESNRDLTSRIEAKWGTGSRTRFDFTHNARHERVTAKQSGSAFADYYTGTTYGAVYNVYGYNLRGELQTSAMYAGNTPTVTPSSGDELPGRRFEYRYDELGNRQTAGATGSAGSADDAYTTNALNQYTQKENNTVRFSGTKKLSASVAASGITVGVKDRAWAADFVPANVSGPAQGTASLWTALVGGGSGGLDLIRTDSKPWFIPPAAQALVYDEDGNLTDDGVFTYTWNAENQLVRATSALPSGAGFTRLRLDFKYDYQGRRVEKRVTDLDTSTETLARRFIHDGWNLIAELDANTPATILRSYAWGLDLTGDLSRAGGVGALISMTNYAAGAPGTSFYPTYDGNGNVVSLVNASNGALAAVYEYDPFGHYLRNEVIDSAVADAPFRFSTKYTDVETGLADYGLRYYSPTLGRFINRDPIEESGGFNLYGFVGNNGVNRWDYLGMKARYNAPVYKAKLKLGGHGSIRHQVLTGLQASEMEMQAPTQHEIMNNLEAEIRQQAAQAATDPRSVLFGIMSGPTLGSLGVIDSVIAQANNSDTTQFYGDGSPMAYGKIGKLEFLEEEKPTQFAPMPEVTRSQLPDIDAASRAAGYDNNRRHEIERANTEAALNSAARATFDNDVFHKPLTTIAAAGTKITIGVSVGVAGGLALTPVAAPAWGGVVKAFRMANTLRKVAVIAIGTQTGGPMKSAAQYARYTLVTRPTVVQNAATNIKPPIVPPVP